MLHCWTCFQSFVKHKVCFAFFQKMEKPAILFMYPANGALHNRASNDEGVQQIRKKPSMQIRLWVVFNTQKFTAKCLVNFLQPKFIYMYSHMSCLLWFGEFSHLGAGAWTKSTGIHQPTPALSATNSWPVFRAQAILQPIIYW